MDHPLRSPDRLSQSLEEIGRRARAASRLLAAASTEVKNEALLRVAAEIMRRQEALLAANASDMAAARAAGHADAFLDRLRLDEGRIDAMARGVAQIARQADPVGEVIADWTRPNGLRIQRVRVPLGVVAIIYESRPNVTADAGAICLKSGNAAILRGGSESFGSSKVIGDALRAGLAAVGLPEDAVQSVPTTDRDAVGHLLSMTRHIDVVIPRGGKSLTARVAAESRIPVIYHLDGLCHVYVDKAADLGKARAIVLNAKMRRPGVCGAAETLLVDSAGAERLLPPIIADLAAAGCEIRGDASVRDLAPEQVVPATEADWDTEYLDAIISVRLVDGVEGAIAHIERHGSHHTDSIVTEDPAMAERFLASVDSGIVLWNASTQFADGGEFGFGAEIGISTGKLHARGPVGAEQLTSYKYLVRGDGQVRP